MHGEIVQASQEDAGQRANDAYGDALLSIIIAVPRDTVRTGAGGHARASETT
jgi:hypothetical protein